MSGGPLLDPVLLPLLSRVTLRTRRPFRGDQAGERRSARPGSGLEFAGHRGYVPGDDLRQLDWALLARLDRPFVKIYEKEADLSVHLLIDATRSMGFGEPSKFDLALRLAAALAYVAVGSLDRVGVAFLGGEALRAHGPARGRGALVPLLRFLESGRADGRGGLRRGLRLHAAAARAGLTFVFSDFFESDAESLLLAHRARRHTLCLVQLLAREELEPRLDGDFKLRDAESGEEIEVTVGRRERAAYAVRLARQRRELRELGARHGIDVLSLPADLGVERALWDHLLPVAAGRVRAGR